MISTFAHQSSPKKSSPYFLKMSPSTIHLQSSDGEKFNVPKEIACKSITIKTMLEDLGLDNDEEDQDPGLFMYFWCLI